MTAPKEFDPEPVLEAPEAENTLMLVLRYAIAAIGAIIVTMALVG